MTKVLMLNASPRLDGNTTTLLSYIEKGIANMGGEIEYLRLRDYNIKPCISCYKCKQNESCHLDDDIEEIYKAITKVETVVFGSPISFWFISPHLKLILDRVILYERGVFQNRGAVLAILTGPKYTKTISCMLNILMRIVHYGRMLYKGKIIASGVLEYGDLDKLEDFKDEAITLGQNIITKK
ncbi:MAG: flavodoxin family protein [Asgard group archaeon]|nr:flavodoxin family protein [Asgard group archaeon]